MTSPDVIRRTVHGACLKAWEKARAKGEPPFVEYALMSPGGLVVLLQAPPRHERRKLGDWLHITPVCATGPVWRAITSLTQSIRERLPECDVWCVSLRFRAPENWIRVYEHKEEAA